MGLSQQALLERSETPVMAALPAGGSSYPSQVSVSQVGTGLALLTAKEAGNQPSPPLSLTPTPTPATAAAALHRTLSIFKKHGGSD